MGQFGSNFGRNFDIPQAVTVIQTQNGGGKRFAPHQKYVRELPIEHLQAIWPVVFPISTETAIMPVSIFGVKFATIPLNLKTQTVNGFQPVSLPEAIKEWKIVLNMMERQIKAYQAVSLPQKKAKGAMNMISQENQAYILYAMAELAGLFE